MSFSPVIPMTGYAGWRFLTRTRDDQEAALARDPAQMRDKDYFRANIARIDSAADLVADRRLLGVALGAFGLGEDINNRFFIRKILDDGTLSPGALANRLADKRYAEFSRAFGFGDYDVPRTQLSDFADRIIERYQTRQFDAAVGAQNNQMRLALNAERELGALAARPGGTDTKWYTALGSAPLREVLHTALGLPKEAGALPIDRQVELLKARALRYFGDDRIDVFEEPQMREKLVRLFLLRDAAQATGIDAGGARTALALLQSAGPAGPIRTRRI